MPGQEVVEDFVAVDQAAMVQSVMYVILQDRYSFEHTPEQAGVAELKTTQKVLAAVVAVLAADLI